MSVYIMIIFSVPYLLPNFIKAVALYKCVYLYKICTCMNCICMVFLYRYMYTCVYTTNLYSASDTNILLYSSWPQLCLLYPAKASKVRCISYDFIHVHVQ